MTDVLNSRRAGILLHISSLPSDIGLGDFSAARRFIDFLADAGFSVWQVLPLGPTHGDLSPYLCTSSFAGNPLFIDLEHLRRNGWLSGDRRPDEFNTVRDYRQACLKESFIRFRRDAGSSWQEDLQNFIELQHSWLPDFALFTALSRTREDTPWMLWPASLRDRDPVALEEISHPIREEIEQVNFEQFVFYQQWHEIKSYAARKGVCLFGDMPLYIAHDSAELWANREFFQVDATGNAKVVAGVPPDYFSQTGQKWGNPVYDWQRLQQQGFRWWLRRIVAQMQLYDLVRIDHFRGLAACWEIPAEAESAVRGRWQKTPGIELLQALQNEFGELPLVAEDLGFITPDVVQLREQFNLPGMKVIQFAFDGSQDNPYLLQRHIENCVVYTGTHDNDTTLGWYRALTEEQRRIVQRELARYQLSTQSKDMPWPLIQYALSSPARLVILPMQDILALDGEHRLNTPGTVEGNWRWQFSWDRIPDELPQNLRSLLLTRLT